MFDWIGVGFQNGRNSDGTFGVVVKHDRHVCEDFFGVSRIIVSVWVAFISDDKFGARLLTRLTN